MIYGEAFDLGDTSRFIQHVFTWLTAHPNLMNHLLLIGIPSTYLYTISTSLKKLGFFVDRGNWETDFSSFQLLVLSSQENIVAEKREKLIKYMNSGGGVAIFFVPGGNTFQDGLQPINSFIYDFGLSYTICSLSNDSSKLTQIDLTQSFTTVQRSTFHGLITKLHELIREAEPAKPSNFDDLVTTLRYQMLVCGPNEAEDLHDVYQALWDFLQKTGYRTEFKTLCPHVTHAMTIVLIDELNAKLPLSMLQAAPCVDIFPGLLPEGVELRKRTIEQKLKRHFLVSTGLAIPAGVLGSIYCENPPANCFVQIGSHSTSLFPVSGPWRRWPNVTCSFPLEAGETKVFSSFGGIVYIAVGDMEEEEVVRTFVFNRTVKHPIYLDGKPKSFDKNQLFFPWGEIHGKRLIFTLPSVRIAELPDIDSTIEQLQKMIKTTAELMGYHIIRPYRVVFDVQTPGMEPVPDYPIVLLIDDFNDIFKPSQPSRGLFHLIEMVALVSFRDGCFDSTTEYALASFITCQVFQKVFCYFQPASMSSEVNYPTMFQELLKIHNKFGPDAILPLVRASMEPDAPTYDDQGDQWPEFVKALCTKCVCDLTKLLENIKPIPLNLAKHLGGLPSEKV